MLGIVNLIKNSWLRPSHTLGAEGLTAIILLNEHRVVKLSSKYFCLYPSLRAAFSLG